MESFKVHKSRQYVSLLLALKKAGVKYVRYASLDVAGLMRSKSVPLERILLSPEMIGTQVVIAEVVWGGVNRFVDYIIEDTKCTAENVLVLKPNMESIRILPHAPTSAVVFCSLHDQMTGEANQFCCRNALQKTIKKAANSLGIAFNVGVELEFCLYRESKDSSELSSKNKFEPVDRSVFAATTTINDQDDLINCIIERLEEMGIHVFQFHSESAPGQLEIILQYEKDPLVLADNVVLAKEVIHACAKKFGLRALFLPKVFPDQAGSGMHLHLSLRDSKTDDNITFHDIAQESGISEKAGAFMEGILEHLSAVMSITMPSTNSFKRVGPGCWTGSSASWAVEDKESSLRVVRSNITGNLDHVEYKLCDSTANIYLALTAVLNAGIDGIQRELKLRASRNDSESPAKPLPSDLSAALEAILADEVMIESFGTRLLNSFYAIKKSEISVTEKMTLDEEINQALSTV